MIGPFPRAKGNLQYAVVALEYYSKWIEANPLTAVTSKNVQKFFWRNIICRLGIPRQITIDNEMKFDIVPF